MPGSAMDTTLPSGSAPCPATPGTALLYLQARRRVNHEHLLCALLLQPDNPLVNHERENHQKSSGNLPLGRGGMIYKIFPSFMVASHCNHKKGLIKVFILGNVWRCSVLANCSVSKYISNPFLQVVTAIKHGSSFS